MSEIEDARIYARIEPSQTTGLRSRVIGLVAFATLITWAVSSRADLIIFLDVESLAIAALGPVTLLVAGYGWTDTKSAFGMLFAVSKPAHSLQAAVDFFRTGAAFALACGFLGALIGFVIMLKNLSDPSMAGPAMATILLTQTYGTMLATLSLVAAISLTRHQTIADAASDSTPLGQVALLVGGPATVVGVLSVVACILVLLLAVSGMPS